MNRTERFVAVLCAGLIGTAACVYPEAAKTVDVEATVCEDAVNPDCAAPANVIIEDE